MPLMNEKLVFLPRDCYTASEVSRLLARRNHEGRAIPISRVALWKQRLRKQIPFIRFGPRSIMYPRVLIDDMLVNATNAIFESCDSEDETFADTL